MADAQTLILATAIIFGAAFVQGVTGFGHALLAIGLLTLLFGSNDAILILAVMAPAIAIAVYVRHWRRVNWREVLVITLPLCLIGLPLGIWLFKYVDQAGLQGTLTRGVGAFLIVSAGYFLSPFAPKPRHLPWPVGASAGALGGFIGGLASTGGPPIVLYLNARDMPKEVRMAVLQAVFVIGSVVKVAMLVAAGLLTKPILLESAILIPPMVVGSYLGQLLFDRLPGDKIRTAALILLLAIGVMLMF
jgi:uncharacterized membrane protein YfcA